MCLSLQVRRVHRFPFQSLRCPTSHPLPEQPTPLVLVLAAAGSGEARSRGGILDGCETRQGGRHDGVHRRRRRHWRRLRRRLTPRARLPKDRLRVCAGESLSMCCMLQGGVQARAREVRYPEAGGLQRTNGMTGCDRLESPSNGSKSNRTVKTPGGKKRKKGGEESPGFTGLAQVIKHEIAGTLAALSLTKVHSLRHRRVRSRQYARRAGFIGDFDGHGCTQVRVLDCGAYVT